MAGDILIARTSQLKCTAAPALVAVLVIVVARMISFVVSTGLLISVWKNKSPTHSLPYAMCMPTSIRLQG